ncbi:MAG: hypothetical protein WBM44_20850 [Waterburya sp.]
MLKNNRQKQSSLSLCLGIALTLIAGLNLSAFAQSPTDDQGYQSNEKDSLYGDAPAGLNPLDLIHRSQQFGGRSAEEFEEESRGQTNNSASDFKRLQQQKILEQQQQPATSVEVVETVE